MLKINNAYEMNESAIIFEENDDLLKSDIEAPANTTDITDDEAYVDLPEHVRKTLKFTAEVQKSLQDEVLNNIVQQFWNNDFLNIRKTESLMKKKRKHLTADFHDSLSVSMDE